MSDDLGPMELVDERHRLQLYGDCDNCFAFCCIALYFSASDGFPEDKEAGKPCVHLQKNFRCRAHQELKELGLKGCLAFDCFGTGQKVAQESFGGRDWQQAPESAALMFDTFLITRLFHELLWYLCEALTLQPAHVIYGALKAMLDETERLTHLSPEALFEFDAPAHRDAAIDLLHQASELVRSEARQGRKVQIKRRKKLGGRADLMGADLRNSDLRGANLRGAYLIAADLRGSDLSGADLLGADLRDTDLRGADLSKSIFLPQGQINLAKGDEGTKLPAAIARPKHWSSLK